MGNYLTEEEFNDNKQFIMDQAKDLEVHMEMVQGDLHITESKDADKEECYAAIEKTPRGYAMMVWGTPNEHYLQGAVAYIQGYLMGKLGRDITVDHF